MDYVVAVDVGGTTFKGGFVARDGTILHFERRVTPRGADQVIAAISAFVADLARPRAGRRPLAVGLAVPGLVTPTHAVYSAAFGWRDVPVSSFADVDLPVALGHDVLFLPIGTGIAGAVVLSGSLYGGAGGFAGQIGHIPVRPDGLACGCGQRGCLAAYASGGAIAARYGSGTSADVVRLAAEGDQRAAEVWSSAVDTLALALATYTLLLDPARIVIGGGVSLAGDALLVPLRERLAGRLAFRRAPEVVASSLGVRAGLLGAGLLGWRSVS
ncbi:ROK family protein [Nonomuraea angiospora]|uniref:ROK family protein n=1 Tax=Nonomuraea angiospora TaxID=46172 RepID=UPI0029B6F91A|nr:ROK family protein [Nonomuraea angiospora]MDX3111262.1 ROK family protein [Nonomuraea angiospora]